MEWWIRISLGGFGACAAPTRALTVDERGRGSLLALSAIEPSFLHEKLEMAGPKSPEGYRMNANQICAALAETDRVLPI